MLQNAASLVTEGRTLSGTPIKPRLREQAAALSLSEYRLSLNPNACIRARENAAQLGHYFVGLDLDECSVLGNDTNDILRVAMHARDFYDDKESSSETLRLIAQKCINPAMTRALSEIRAKVGHMPYVFVYTNKGSVAEKIYFLMEAYRKYFDKIMRSRIVDAQDKQYLREWSNSIKVEERSKRRLNGLTTFLEGTNASYDFDYLERGIRNDMEPLLQMYAMYLPADYKIVSNSMNIQLSSIRQDIERLGLVTWAISEVLNLDYRAAVFVSNATYKDLDTVVPALGLSNKDRLWLYDDKSNQHFEKMRLTKRVLREKNALDAHMIQIQPFTSRVMAPWTRQAIASWGLERIVRDPAAFFLEFDTVLTEVSVATTRWPRECLIFNKQKSRFELGAGSIGRMVGSQGFEPWPTSMFEAFAAPAPIRTQTYSHFSLY